MKRMHSIARGLIALGLIVCIGAPTPAADEPLPPKRQPVRPVRPVRPPPTAKPEFQVSVKVKRDVLVEAGATRLLTTASGAELQVPQEDIVASKLPAQPKPEARPAPKPAPGRVPIRDRIARPLIVPLPTLGILAVSVEKDAKAVTVVTPNKAKLLIPSEDVMSIDKIEQVADASVAKNTKLVMPGRDLQKLIKLPTPQIQKHPKEINLIAGGQPVIVPLGGEALNLIGSAEVHRKDKPYAEVDARLGAPARSSRPVYLQASSEAAAGEYTLRFKDTAGKLLKESIPLTVSLVTKLEPIMLEIDAIVKRPPIRIPVSPKRDDVTHYDVWRTGSNQWNESLHLVRQPFIAAGTHLSEARINAGGTGDVKVRVFEDKPEAPLLVNQRATLEADKDMTVTFDPPIPLTPGTIYYLEIRSATTNGKFTAYGSKQGADYAWSYVRRHNGDEWLSQKDWDLNVRLNGWWENMPAAAKESSRPGKKALLVLLENGGIALDGVDEINDLKPDITIAKCGNFRFELGPDESIFDKIAQLWQTIGHCANPDNWSFDRLSFDEWWEPVSDYIAESISTAVASAVSGTTSRKYDKVVQLEDQDFTRDRVMEELKKLSKDYVVDIHVLCHGGDNVFIGYNNEGFSPSTFFIPLKQKMITGEIPLKLRAVYQMNCVSGTLVDDWQAAGAKVVNGTSGKLNNYMPTQYHHFLTHWLSGKKFKESVDSSFNEAKVYFGVIYIGDSSLVSDSKHTTHGDVNATMSTP